MERSSIRTPFARFAASSMLIVLTITSVAARADVAVYDDFDDAALDPAWQIEFQDALGWTYVESESDLTVTDIDPAVINDAGGGTWAYIRLSRAIQALSDFHADFDFSWDCEGSVTAMQGVRIMLLDSNGATIIGAGYSDCWVSARGCQYAHIGSSSQCEPNELPFMGSASVDIDRIGDSVTITWDDTPLMSDNLSAHVAGVEIAFSFYAYQWNASFFGTESVDLVSMEGDLTAVDGINWGALKRGYR